MSDPLDRLSGLAPHVDHERARAYFDRRRSQLRLRRRIAAGAAAGALVLAGSIAALAGNGADSSTSVSTADATEPDGPAVAGVESPSVVVLSDGTGTSQHTVANALSECGFDVTVEASDIPAGHASISVSSSERHQALATTTATIVGAPEVGVVSDSTRPAGDITVTVHDGYDADSIDTSACPVASLFEVGGPPLPGTPPLLTIDVDVEGVRDLDVTAAVYGTHTIDPDTPAGMCVGFSISGLICGGDTDRLPGLVGGVYGSEAALVVFIGPPSAAGIEIRGDDGAWTASAHPIPAGIDIDGTVAVIDLSNATRITDVTAVDASGSTIARNSSPRTLDRVNRSLDHRSGPVDPPVPGEGAAECGAATDQDPVVGVRTVTYLPDGFVADGPVQERGTGDLDQGGESERRQRFTGPDGRWLEVVDFGSYAPRGYIESEAAAPLEPVTVPGCWPSGDGQVERDVTALVAERPDRTLVGTQEWEYGGYLVVGGPGVVRDQVLAVFSGLQRT